MRFAALLLWLVASFAAVTNRSTSRLAWTSRKHGGHAPNVADQHRTISFINSCNIPVQVGFTSGSMGVPCSQTCPNGGLCQLGQCYFPSLLPAQSNPSGNYLRLNPGQKSAVPLTVSGQYGFGGALYVSTGCDSYAQTCETAICRGKVCDPFTGPVGPHTRAEFFMDTVDGTDYYDVSLIHGANVPITMGPVGGGVAPVDFTCQTAGAVQPSQNLPGCSYKFNPYIGNVNQSSSLMFVAAPLDSPKPCRGDADCGSPFRCGLAAGRDPTGLPTDTVSRVCGKPVGLWSANEVCVYDQNFDQPFSCPQPSALPGGRYTDLYACSGPYAFSGYDTGHGESPANVCGCFNWKQPTFQQCIFDNSEWERVSFPWAKFLKEGCPTAYSYPFDDMTSSFQCVPQSPTRSVDYQFEFCPLNTQISIG